MNPQEPYIVLPASSFSRALAGLARKYGESAYVAVVELIEGDLALRPHAGVPLRGPLTGRRRMARGPYRVVYRVEEEQRTVRLLDVDHRSDIYRTSGP